MVLYWNVFFGEYFYYVKGLECIVYVFVFMYYIKGMVYDFLC